MTKLKFMKRIFKNVAVVFTIVITLAACDNDLNTLGTDFLGVNLDSIIKTETFNVVTFSSALNPVQTNRFGSQPFGIYEDPVYGRSTYEFATQARIPAINPDFGTAVEIDSVVLSIPLFSRVTVIDGENRSYALDSIYNGEATTFFNLYENNLFLSDFDTQDLTAPARYFSNLGPSFASNKGPLLLGNIPFKPNAAEVRLITSDVNGDRVLNGASDFVVNSREAPALRTVIARAGDVNSPILNANIDYWRQKIFNQQGSTNLSSIREFQNFFRGFYFEIATNTSPEGNFSHLNVNQGAVIIYYKSVLSNAENPTSATYRIAFAGNRATLINNNLNPAILSSIQAGGNQVTGDANLYLKGGPGAMAFVDLFGADLNMDGEADALTALKARDVIINDATLTFFVDQSQVTAGRTEPERIIIYDSENNVALADFVIATGNNAVASINSNTGHLGRLVRSDSGNLNSPGVSYTLRLTNHVTNILAGRTENVRLAIAVSQNVDLFGAPPFVLDNNAGNAITISQILASTAISHEGTILHGNTSPEISKRPVLKISYTETN